MDMFPLPLYQFIRNNRVHGVVLYVRDIVQVNIRNDLTINYGVELKVYSVKLAMMSRN